MIKYQLVYEHEGRRHVFNFFANNAVLAREHAIKVCEENGWEYSHFIKVDWE